MEDRITIFDQALNATEIAGLQSFIAQAHETWQERREELNASV